MGIAYNTTLAKLWENGNWILPPARSENNVNVFTFLSTLSITENQDGYEWCPDKQISMKYKTRRIYYLLREHDPEVTWHKEV